MLAGSRVTVHAMAGQSLNPFHKTKVSDVLQNRTLSGCAIEIAVHTIQYTLKSEYLRVAA